MTRSHFGPLDDLVEARTSYVFTGDSEVPLLATAIHAGHEIRPEVSSFLKLDEASRLREEDPFTDQIANCGCASVAVSRSRFEVDLNRARADAVYRIPNDHMT